MRRSHPRAGGHEKGHEKGALIARWDRQCVGQPKRRFSAREARAAVRRFSAAAVWANGYNWQTVTAGKRLHTRKSKAEAQQHVRASLCCTCGGGKAGTSFCLSWAACTWWTGGAGAGRGWHLG